jgi:N,N'-diacetyllegionaminate synthase
MTVGDQSIPFGTRRIGDGAPVFIIAEIGINHEGDEPTCAGMIEAAARAGADAIKLQTVDPNESYAPGTPSHALFSRAILSRDATARQFDLARRLGVEPFTTCGDLPTLEWVEKLGPAGHKISSGLLTHLPLIRRVAATGRSVLMSTGMATDEDIDVAVAAVRGAPFVLLQCTSLYPAPEGALNLRAIAALEKRYRVPVGFSDHSITEEAPALAVAAGAVAIEKHFTLDTSRLDFDHRLSLDPAGFARMVKLVRRAEQMLGTGEKKPGADEIEVRKRAHRILVARRALQSGQLLAEDDVVILRSPPGAGGLAPAFLDRVVGRRIVRDVAAYAPITSEVIEGAL